MKVGSTFSGVGGFDLGLERAGMQILWQAEIDQWAKKFDRLMEIEYASSRKNR